MMNSVKKQPFFLIKAVLLFSILLISFVFFKGILYGDKKDVIKEIESNNKNKAVEDDSDSLEIALAVQKAIRNVAQSVSPSVVNIRSERVVKKSKKNRDPFFDFFGDEFGRKGPQKLQSLGSGFVISKDGYIVTNNHVVKDADQITILFPDENEYEGTIVGKDPRTDIAVIRIKPKKELPAIPFGNSDEVETGDFAIAIGNPFGLKGTFTLGVISARGRDRIDADAGLKNYIQTDASINQGNSGGPLLNIRGQAIGMNTAIYSTTGGSVGIGFAIPINIVKRVVTGIIAKGFVERGYLGVTITPIPEKVAKYLKLDKKDGIFVHDVNSGGPASKAGIQVGDVILKVDGKKMKSVSQLQRIISEYKKDQKVAVQIYRNGKKIDLEVTIGEAKSEKISKKGKSYVGPGKKFLGMTVGSIEDNYQFYSIDKKMKGVVVVDLEENSIAAESGLKIGDVIQIINYVDIRSIDDFDQFIKENKNKKEFLVKIKRRGKNRFIVIEDK